MSGSEAGEARKRRWRSVEERRAIVAETLQPGASVARVAQAHGVNANLVFKWRRQYGAGCAEKPDSTVELVPVKLRPGVGHAPLVEGSESIELGDQTPGGVIQIQLGKARLRIEGRADPATLRVVLKALRG